MILSKILSVDTKIELFAETKSGWIALEMKQVNSGAKVSI
jgi:hypothetical protein